MEIPKKTPPAYFDATSLEALFGLIASLIGFRSGVREGPLSNADLGA